MRFSAIPSLLFLAAGAVQAASSWSFDDASVAISSKKGVGEAHKEKFGAKSPLETPVTLGAQDTLTVSFTAKDNGKAKRPHQAFVLLRDEDTGLEAPFPLNVKESGKGKVQITQKEIPAQFFLSSKPVHATVVIGSFGSAQGLIADAFDIEITQDPNKPAPAAPSPVRYGKKPQIHHIFREPTQYPYKVFSIIFVIIIAATLPILLVAWFGFLGANISALPKALGAAPLSHATFFGSILAIEGVYFLYHRGLSLGHILVPIAVFGTTTVLSGMKALGEVQRRRLAGER
ncbi:Dolichyl-diphosphooligosaccharide--protein glycosyltransferase subunit 2 [Cytospora mali]|uniref:Ribophorin II n=1 Tax=Cytospora mali TaxID=578113 RepID=A0A194W3C8_CYTMA|nr:Dolichyl-diphosphooligosaccharide--protein glycosyltransferase subunit 2 [Valsa mali]